MTMIERIVGAIKKSAQVNYDGEIEDIPYIAESILEEMRRPTDAMHDAVESMLEERDFHMDCAINDVWRTMIDAALKEAA